MDTKYDKIIDIPTKFVWRTFKISVTHTYNGRDRQKYRQMEVRTVGRTERGTEEGADGRTDRWMEK